MSLKENIFKLHNEGKTNKEICEILNCAHSTVSYHLNPSIKEKAYKLTKKNRAEKWEYRFMHKVSNFQNRKIRSTHKVQMCKDWKKKFRTAVSGFRNRYKDKNNSVEYYSNQEVLNYLRGTKVKCYLTGHDINIETDDFQLDHIIPVSKGGTNILTNMGITTPEVNQMKYNFTIDELLYWCKEILQYNGYKVEKLN